MAENEDEPRRTAYAHQQMAESFGLLILAADALGLRKTKAALAQALRRLDREMVLSPPPDTSPGAAAGRSGPGPAAQAPPRHPR